MRIRPVALAIIRRDEDILVGDCHDTAKGERFFRPLGGGIEFGELGEDALKREFVEEIGAELRDVKFLGILENKFTFNDEPGHEIVLLYEAALQDRSFYEKEEFTALDGQSVVCWKPLASFEVGGAPLYPAGLLQLLKRQHQA